MVDVLRAGTKAGEVLVGGMAGGVAYSIIEDGIPGTEDLLWIFFVFAVLVLTIIALRLWYERQRGELFW